MKKQRKLICRLLYEAVGKYLPGKTSPGGKIATKIRRFLVNGFIKSCGHSVNVERNASISSSLVVGNHSGIGRNARISPCVTIGDYVMMGPNCTIYTRNHRHEWNGIPFVQQGFEDTKPVQIGNNVWIGGNVTILPGRTIGDNVVIGAGAVVTKDVPDNCIVGGNPAKILSRMS